jgi:hypothetical protein
MPDSGTIEVSELCFIYIVLMIADDIDERVTDTFHVDNEGEIVITATGERVISSADSEYAFDEVSNRWSLMQRFVAGNMVPLLAVRTAINIYNSIPAELVLTNRAVSQICAHYANDGDRSLVFEFNHQGDVIIHPSDDEEQQPG